MTIQCCVCKRVEQDGQWCRLSGALGKNVSHTYCPVCYEASMAAMRAERKAAIGRTAVVTA